MEVLIFLHILSGFIALAGAALALSGKKGGKFHIASGRLYFWSMLVLFLTAIPMSVINSNVFLFLIAIFSFYLAFAGLQFGRNKSGNPGPLDWVAVLLMIASGPAMWALASLYFVNDDSQYITLLLFGSLAIFLGYGDYKSHRDKLAVGKERIARHLTNMLGGTIAVITAALVVNAPPGPEWIWWILPTLVITPLIIRWNRKTLN